VDYVALNCIHRSAAGVRPVATPTLREVGNRNATPAWQSRTQRARPAASPGPQCDEPYTTPRWGEAALDSATLSGHPWGKPALGSKTERQQAETNPVVRRNVPTSTENRATGLDESINPLHSA